MFTECRVYLDRDPRALRHFAALRARPEASSGGVEVRNASATALNRDLANSAPFSAFAWSGLSVYPSISFQKPCFSFRHGASNPRGSELTDVIAMRPCHGDEFRPQGKHHRGFEVPACPGSLPVLMHELRSTRPMRLSNMSLLQRAPGVSRRHRARQAAPVHGCRHVRSPERSS